MTARTRSAFAPSQPVGVRRSVVVGVTMLLACSASPHPRTPASKSGAHVAALPPWDAGWGPRVHWEPDPPATQRTLRDGERTLLAETYVRAIRRLQRAAVTGDLQGLHAERTEGALLEAIAAVEQATRSRYSTSEIDLEHALELRSISADRRTAVLSDRAIVERVAGAGRDNAEGRATPVEVRREISLRLDSDGWHIFKLVTIAEKEVVASPTRLAGSHRFLDAAGGSFVLGAQRKKFAMRGFNYYPASAPWAAFWTSYPPAVVENDLAAMALAGANTIRIFVDFRASGGAAPGPRALATMNHLLSAAERNHLHVVITLFDFYSDYSLLYWQQADRHLEYWLTAFADSPVVAAWDLKNEPDLDRDKYGDRVVDRFFRFVAKRARIYDRNHLLTIGWHDGNNALEMRELLDFASFHDYGDARNLGARSAEMRQRCAPNPVVLEEYGASSAPGTDVQTRYFESSLPGLATADVAGELVWTWRDFSQRPTAVFGGNAAAAQGEARFGMIDVGGGEKPALQLMKTHLRESLGAP